MEDSHHKLAVLHHKGYKEAVALRHKGWEVVRHNWCSCHRDFEPGGDSYLDQLRPSVGGVDSSVHFHKERLQSDHTENPALALMCYMA